MINFFIKRGGQSGLLLMMVASLPVLCGSASGVSSDRSTAVSSESPVQPITIVTTIRPLELIVRDLIGEELADRFVVTTLISPSVSPHGFEPTPRQIATLHRADVVIYNGGGLDDWAGRNLPDSVRAIRFADVADEHHHHHHHDDGGHHACCAHGHGPVDEHYWLDVELVKEFIELCEKQLIDMFSRKYVNTESLSPQFEASRRRMLAAIDEVDASFRESLQSYRNRRLVTHHDVFRRIAQRYELADPLVLRPLATAEPSPGDLRRAVRTIRAERVQAILVEPQFNPASAQRIRDETNVRLVGVDPLGAEAKSWPALMHSIRTAIVQCFGGS
jgi:zinc transport system substrate-binding protein